jgi:small ubiquitin-related modifier
MSDSGSPNQQQKPEGAEQSEHLNIKVTDNNNEVFFKIKRTTQLKKLMDAFCERQGKSPASVRFLFEGVRVQPTDNPETVSYHFLTTTYSSFNPYKICPSSDLQFPSRSYLWKPLHHEPSCHHLHTFQRPQH